MHGNKILFLEDDLIRKNMITARENKNKDDQGNSHILIEDSTQGHILNEHKEYQRKTKELQNKRIGKLLTNRSNNPALQNYLEDKSNFDTASLGETSADELAIKSGEDSSGSIDIVRTNTLSKKYDEEK